MNGWKPSWAALLLSGMALAGDPVPGGSPLAAAIGKMEEVRGDLAREETGLPTQERIREVIEELDKLTKPSELNPRSPVSDGPGDTRGDFWFHGLLSSRESNHQGAVCLTPFTRRSSCFDGRRVPIEPERSIAKAREAKLPAQYERQVRIYYAVLSSQEKPR